MLLDKELRVSIKTKALLELDFNVESFKLHPVYSKYEVSNLGKVRNIESNKISNGSLNNNGYILFRLVYDGKKITKTAHRLVMETFCNIGEASSNYDINHIDGNKENNSITNLEWLTTLENIQHAQLSGKYKKAIGDSNKSTKFREEDIKNMKRLKTNGYKLKDIAELYGSSISYICTLTTRKTKNVNK